MNSVRMRWSRRSEDRERRTVGVGPAKLGACGALVERRLRHRLDPGVEERFHDRAARQRAGRPAEQRVGGRVGGNDPQAAIDA